MHGQVHSCTFIIWKSFLSLLESVTHVKLNPCPPGKESQNLVTNKIRDTQPNDSLWWHCYKLSQFFLFFLEYLVLSICRSRSSVYIYNHILAPLPIWMCVKLTRCIFYTIINWFSKWFYIWTYHLRNSVRLTLVSSVSDRRD